jgi:peptide-methionine (R)-S-oxide reductase
VGQAGQKQLKIMPEPYETGPKSTAIETMTRRAWLVGGSCVAMLTGLWWMHDDSADAAAFEIVKTDAEWRRLLKPEAYRVLRHEGTERPYTSPLNAEKRKGTFACAGCDLPLFASETKFESGTGWPSFFKPLPNAVATSKDRTLLIARTEVHCRRCGGHLGHVFDDGPPPTGLRYCMNGVALTFKPAGAGPA